MKGQPRKRISYKVDNRTDTLLLVLADRDGGTKLGVLRQLVRAAARGMFGNDDRALAEAKRLRGSAA